MDGRRIVLIVALLLALIGCGIAVSRRARRLPQPGIVMVLATVSLSLVTVAHTYLNG